MFEACSDASLKHAYVSIPNWLSDSVMTILPSFLYRLKRFSRLSILLLSLFTIGELFWFSFRLAISLCIRAIRRTQFVWVYFAIGRAHHEECNVHFLQSSSVLELVRKEGKRMVKKTIGLLQLCKLAFLHFCIFVFLVCINRLEN